MHAHAIISLTLALIMRAMATSYENSDDLYALLDNFTPESTSSRQHKSVYIPMEDFMACLRKKSDQLAALVGDRRKITDKVQGQIFLKCLDLFQPERVSPERGY